MSLENFIEIKPEEMENAQKLIGSDYMLITAGDPERYNTMTASWGCLGVLWGKPVCVCFIRPQRYTYEFVESNDEITFSFFDEDYKKALTFCGTHSGRDYDKAKECGLTAIPCGNKTTAFDEARLILVCRKLFAEDMKEESFLDKELLKNYKNNDFHRTYVCEIVKVYKHK